MSNNLNMVSSVGSYSGSPGSGSPGAIPNPYPFDRPLITQFPAGKVPERIASATAAEDITWDTLQREWKTPPLWGLADSAPYLHDGRAETIDAAIRWHGGEASDSVTKYRSLEKSERQQLLRFLGSLRAPSDIKEGFFVSTAR